MKKRFLSLALALVMCLGLSVPAMAAEKAIEEVIPCEYSNVGWFYEGLAWVEVDGKYGYIDKTGEVVIAAVYDEVVDFSEGLAPVKQNGKWGFINTAGETVVDFVYDYDKIYPFSEGYAVIVRDNKYGYIDQAGKVRTICHLPAAHSFSEGFAAFQQDDGMWNFLNENFLSAHLVRSDNVRDFSEGLAAVKESLKIQKWGFIDQTGKVVIPYRYDGADMFSDGLAAVWTDGKIGFVNKDCEEVIPLQYEDAVRFSDGFTLVQQGGKWGVIDKTGKEIVPFQYDDAGSFVDGFAPVVQGGKCGYINTAGKVVVPFQYDSAADFSDGMARVAMKQADGSYRYGFLAIVDAPEVTATVSEWAKESVDKAAAAGLIADGLGENYTKYITRAQFAAVAVKLYEAMSGETAPADSDKTFTDTSDPAVLQAAALGIVGGYDDGSFGPDDLVTREQAATMLSRVYTKLGGEIPAVDATAFADDSDMSGYARSAVAFMADQKIVGGVGDNKFGPQGNASIEQALVIALRMLEKLK